MSKEKKIDAYIESIIEDGIEEYLKNKSDEWFYHLMDKTLE